MFRSLMTALALFAIPAHARAYSIQVVLDATGDGSGNTSVRPYDVVVDSNDNVFVSNNTSDNVFQIEPDGTINEIIDTTGDGLGNSLVGATGLAVDSNDSVYVNGNTSDNIFIITPGGGIAEIIDAAGDGFGNPLNGPYRLAVDSINNVYVQGLNSDNAFRITTGGIITQIIDATGDGFGNPLNGPFGIAVNSTHDVYVGGSFSNNVFKITPLGGISEVLNGTGDGLGNGLGTPWSITVDANDNVYVVGLTSDNVFKITPGGNVSEIIDATGDGLGNVLTSPFDVAVDANNIVYVTGAGSDNIFQITPNGTITEILDENGDGLGNTLNSPYGVAVNSNSEVFVVGSFSDNVFQITDLFGDTAIEWNIIFDYGNGPDPEIMDDGTTGYGQVPYAYEISQYETTNLQYRDFLNAVAASDTNGLYNPEMESSALGGIIQAGSPGSHTYVAKAGLADRPVNFVSFWDALRYANWEHNGRPAGQQDNSTTEDGAYTITPAGILANSITRNPAARVFLTSEDEWYKAAYHGNGSVYYDYPTETDIQTTCALPSATPNQANCDVVLNALTGVGAYTASVSPNGTFDQGGNVGEWTESIGLSSSRYIRGGAVGVAPGVLSAASSRADTPVTSELDVIGFRVARVRPQVPALGPLGGAMLLAVLCGTAVWRLRVTPAGQPPRPAR